MPDSPHHSTGDPIAIADFTLDCADEDWHVRRIHIDETTGRPFRAVVDLISTNTSLEIDELIGTDARLSIDRDGTSHSFAGVVFSIEDRGRGSHRLFVRMTIRPALAALERDRRSRIFQHKTVVEILQALVEPVFSARDRTLDLGRLGVRSFEPRDYCVQYRETDLAMFHRLMEEEGLTYVFDTRDSKHETVVVLDGPELFADFSGRDGTSVVPVIEDRAEQADIESVQSFSWRRAPPAASVAQRDWDWASDPATVHEETAAPDEGDGLEPRTSLPSAHHHEHGDHRMLDWRLAARASRKREAVAAQEGIGHAQSNATGMAPGIAFELEGHEHDNRYRVLRVVHRGDAPEADAVAGASQAARYSNEFECIPASRPFRPARVTPRPVVVGPQTAVVTGPPGEEIHTDAHGRIKIRLHWDRETNAPEEASCWVRVAQAWGGPGWGSMFLPRVGMEVVVFFVDGDPDRPMCMGSVYNAQNRPPYPLPDQRSRTTIKTRSTPGGDGFNELRFEDAAGAEQIFVHAQRDLDEVVHHDHTRSVGAEETVSVGGSRTVTVAGNHSVTVQGKGGDGAALPAPHYRLDVDGDAALRASNTIHASADDCITLQCKQTTLVLTPDAITLQSGGGAKVVLDVRALVESKPGAFLHLDAQGGATAQSTAPSSLRLDATARVQSKGGAHVMLAGDAKLAAGGEAGTPGASLTLDQDARLTGNALMLTSEAAALQMTTDAKLQGIGVEVCGTTTTCTAATALSLGGAKVELSGAALVTVVAPLVKIN